MQGVGDKAVNSLFLHTERRNPGGVSFFSHLVLLKQNVSKKRLIGESFPVSPSCHIRSEIKMISSGDDKKNPAPLLSFLEFLPVNVGKHA